MEFDNRTCARRTIRPSQLLDRARPDPDREFRLLGRLCLLLHGAAVLTLILALASALRS